MGNGSSALNSERKMIMISITCKQCGAPLECQEESVFISGDVAMFRKGRTIKCQYCGVVHESGDEVVAEAVDTIVTGDITGSCVAIGRGAVAVAGSIHGSVYLGDKCE
jgi:hypothetical protein